MAADFPGAAVSVGRGLQPDAALGLAGQPRCSSSGLGPARVRRGSSAAPSSQLRLAGDCGSMRGAPGLGRGAGPGRCSPSHDGGLPLAAIALIQLGMRASASPRAPSGRLAPLYQGLEWLAFGRDLERARFRLLDRNWILPVHFWCLGRRRARSGPTWRGRPRRVWIDCVDAGGGDDIARRLLRRARLARRPGPEPCECSLSSAEALPVRRPAAQV